MMLEKFQLYTERVWHEDFIVIVFGGSSILLYGLFAQKRDISIISLFLRTLFANDSIL